MISLLHAVGFANSYDFDSNHCIVVADICTPWTKVPIYVKKLDISERFVNTTLEKLENLHLNSTNSVMNDFLISAMDSATKETLPVQENQSWHDYIILNELYDLKNCQIAQNPISNELSKTQKRTRLHGKFFKNKYFKAEAAKINQSVINRELDKLFLSKKARINFETSFWKMFS